ncbi:TOLL-like receptor [Chamberlinius hualienensis]
MKFPILNILWSLVIAYPLNVKGQATECFAFFSHSYSLKCIQTFPWPPFPQMSQLYALTVQGPTTFNFISRENYSDFSLLRQLIINNVRNLRLEKDNFGPINNSLAMLQLHHCDIKSMPESFLCHLHNLRIVNFTFNAVENTDNLGFGNPNECNSSTEVLDISYNQITRLQSNLTLCQRVPQLHILHLSFNEINTININAFMGCNNLKELYLDNNNLTNISPTALIDLIHLETLDISGNKNIKFANFLHSLPNLRHLFLIDVGLINNDLKNDTFKSNVKIRQLYLDYNHLTDINPQALAPLIKKDTKKKQCTRRIQGLVELSLCYNGFKTLPPIIKQIPNLQRLSMAGNFITRLNDNDLVNMTAVYHFNMTDNRLKFISANVFRRLCCLVYLYLGSNQIEHIEPGAFDHSHLFKRIDVSHNRLQTINGLFLNNTNYILNLDLSHNRLYSITLADLPLPLKILNVSHNELQTIGQKFPQHVHMLILDLSFNHLNSIKNEQLPISLLEIYLHNNRLHILESGVFCTISRINTITMHNNSLESVHYNWLTVYNDEATITLDGNPLKCDCYLGAVHDNKEPRNMPKLIDYKSWTCERVYQGNFNDSSLSVYMSSNQFDFLCQTNDNITRQLPDGCSAYQQVHGTVVVGECFNTTLTQIPKAFPPTIVTLNFSGNYLPTIDNTTLLHWPSLQFLYLNVSHIEVIDKNSFVNTVQLRELSLQGNFLEIITNETFSGLSKLVFLDLTYNRLTKIDSNAFKQTRRLQQLLLSNNQLIAFPVWKLEFLRSINHLEFHNNPWSCDCGFLENYLKFIQEYSNKIPHLKEISCTLSDTVTVPITTFNMTRYCYQNPTFVQSPYFPLTLGLLTTTVIFVTLFVAGYIYRKEMQIIIYSRYGVRVFAKNRDNLDEDRVFDAFVAYSNDDEDFLLAEFLPGLQDTNKPYYLCLHHQHFIAGIPITDNIRAAVSKSRRTIILLSENFIRSEFCRYEFKMAYIQMLQDQCNRVIVVLIGNVPNNLEPEMNLYLKTNTYLTWSDKKFWPKLYFSMPEVPRQPIEDLIDNESEYTVLLNEN